MAATATQREPLTYRFNYLDQRNHIRRFDECNLDSDALASERARTLYGRQPLEVWQGSRFICRIEADGQLVEGQM